MPDVHHLSPLGGKLKFVKQTKNSGPGRRRAPRPTVDLAILAYRSTPMDVMTLMMLTAWSTVTVTVTVNVTVAWHACRRHGIPFARAPDYGKQTPNA
jgi:hypothetical protein